MAALLTWNHAGPQASTGTTIGACFTDLNTLITSKAGDANFKWQVASSSLAATPYYIVLKPKSGAAGRILIVAYSSAPAGANTALWEVAAGSISLNTLFVAWFPNGNVDTPSNLAAASGTILGNDTGLVRPASLGAIATTYVATFQWSYVDSDEAVWFMTQASTGGNVYGGAAGNILVDAADNAYGGTLGSGVAASGLTGAAASSTTTFPWQQVTRTAGPNASAIRSNVGAAGRAFAFAFIPSGGWNVAATASVDPTTDTSGSRIALFPIGLVEMHGTALAVKEGAAMKLRQVAFGPPHGTAWQAYNSAGPVIFARALLPSGGATQNGLWLTFVRM